MHMYVKLKQKVEKKLQFSYKMYTPVTRCQFRHREDTSVEVRAGLGASVNDTFSLLLKSRANCSDNKYS